MSIQELRKYRIELDNINFVNNESNGIALFDLVLSFIGAFILDYIFNLSSMLPCKNKKEIYYLLVIPFGILVHHIIAHINSQTFFIPEEFTFLNKKIFSLEFNIYKLLILLILYLIYTKC
jgi:hypothetical protein